MAYLDVLIENCKLAKKAEPNSKFAMEAPKNIDDLTVLDKIKSAIYVIKEIKGDPEYTLSKLKAYKAKKERSCPKINDPSCVLYVGSSTTGLKTRIKQHMGWGTPKTYALHLAHWFDHGRYEIEISTYDVDAKILLLIEDALADKLKPAFGKRGGNINS